MQTISLHLLFNKCYHESFDQRFVLFVNSFWL